jgi:hypothetical protein
MANTKRRGTAKKSPKRKSTGRKASKGRKTSKGRRASSPRKAWVPFTWAEPGRRSAYPVPAGGLPCPRRRRRVSSRGCGANGRPLSRKASKGRVGARELAGLRK